MEIRETNTRRSTGIYMAVIGLAIVLSFFIWQHYTSEINQLDRQTQHAISDE